MASTITFSTSIFVLLVLFLAKWREVSSGSKNWVTGSISKLDPLASRLKNFWSFRYLQVTQTIKYIFLIVIPRRTEESFREAKRAAFSHYNKQKDILLGRKDLANGNSASFYLKKIKENNAYPKSGRIEEENI